MRDCDTYVIGSLTVHELAPLESFIVTPRGRRFFVDHPAQGIREWVRLCDGTRDRAQLLAAMPDDFGEVFDVLVHDGVLQPFRGVHDRAYLKAPHQGLDLGRLRRTRYVVVGDTAMTDPMAAALDGAGFRVHRAQGIAQPPALLVPPDTVVIGAYTAPDLARIRELTDACAIARAPFVVLVWQEGRAFLGPAITPGGPLRFQDLLDRRRAAAHSAVLHDRGWSDSGSDTGPAMTAAELRWTASVAAARIERWIGGMDGSDLADQELELDPVELTVHGHPVLPVPAEVGGSPAEGRSAARLVDSHTGLVTGIRTFTGHGGTPPTLHLAVADLADMSRVRPWYNDRNAFGSSWSGASEARAAALGESVERYCASWTGADRPTVWGSFDELTRKGVPALDPRRLVLHSARQRAGGISFPDIDTSSPLSWLGGHSLTDDREIWVPAFAVYANWHTTHPQEIVYAYPTIGGNAAGSTLEQAQTAALEEVVEHDAEVVWWANAQPLPRLPCTPEIEAHIAPVRERYDVRLIHLDNEFGVPVIAAVVRQREHHWLTIGTAARPDAETAALKALAEAFTLQNTCQNLDNPHVVDQLRSGAGRARRGLKPWRADRRYLDSYHSDLRDAVDLMTHQQLYLDPRAAGLVAGWAWDLPTREWEGLPRLPDRSRDALRQRVEAAGFDVISVDLTTPDVAAAGYHAVHVIVPGLTGPSPAAYPRWGGRRVQDAAVRLGWREHPLDEEDLTVLPLPG